MESQRTLNCWMVNPTCSQVQKKVCPLRGIDQMQQNENIIFNLEILRIHNVTLSREMKPLKQH